jgi:hypothetical protein
VAFTDPRRTELTFEFAFALGLDGVGASTVSVDPAGEGVAAAIVRDEAAVRRMPRRCPHQ